MEDDNGLNFSHCGGRDCPSRHSLLDPGMRYEEIQRRGSRREPCLTVSPIPPVKYPRLSPFPGETLAAYRARQPETTRLFREAQAIASGRAPQPKRLRPAPAGDLWSDYDGFDAGGDPIDWTDHDHDRADGDWDWEGSPAPVFD